MAWNTCSFQGAYVTHLLAAAGVGCTNVAEDEQARDDLSNESTLSSGRDRVPGLCTQPSHREAQPT